MRISDWSSDVCSSDLPRPPGGAHEIAGLVQSARSLARPARHQPRMTAMLPRQQGDDRRALAMPAGGQHEDRKSTRLNSVTNAHLVCRLLLEKKNNTHCYQRTKRDTSNIANQTAKPPSDS